MRGRSTIFSKPRTATHVLSVWSVVTEGHWAEFFGQAFDLQEFLDNRALRTTTDRILARSKIIPRVADVIKGWNANELSATLDRLNICFSPINRPEICSMIRTCCARRPRQ